LQVNHIGSRRFRDYIETYKERYQASETKYQKMVITKEIYNNLKKSYRFLKLNKAEGVWEEVSDMLNEQKGEKRVLS
jgi:beta-N-acetylglucosaminidase